MVELRWYSTRRNPTAAQVSRYRNEHNVSMDKAASTLKAETRPHLQFRESAEHKWLDVPNVVEVLE